MRSTFNFISRLPLPRKIKNLLLYPPGHFYSPIPSLEELKLDEEKIFGPPPKELPGIDLNIDEQLSMFDTLKQYYRDLPFPETRTKGFRYYYDNETFSYSDAIVLYAVMRHLRPKRIVEVGSGFSSCVMLDTIERFLANDTECVFIDPYPNELRSLLRNKETAKVTIMEQRLQDVDGGVFQTLGAGDILFIDSTHVAKAGSDVNRLIFDILPTLRSGVFVHLHDIMYPFEYPREWIYEGRAWNEAYLLRAFLQYNSAFKIIFFSTYLERFYEKRFQKEMPLCLKNRGGSIWLKKV